MFTFNAKNPSDNGGVFNKALTLGQWEWDQKAGERNSIGGTLVLICLTRLAGKNLRGERRKR